MRLEVCPLKQTRQKPVPWAAPWKAQMLDTRSSFSLPQGKIRVGNFLVIMLCWGRCAGEWVPWIFLLASMQLISHLRVVQEPLDWFLDFSQRELLCALLLIWFLSVGERVWCFLFYRLAVITLCLYVLYQVFIIIILFWKFKHDLIGI